MPLALTTQTRFLCVEKTRRLFSVVPSFASKNCPRFSVPHWDPSNTMSCLPFPWKRWNQLSTCPLQDLPQAIKGLAVKVFRRLAQLGFWLWSSAVQLSSVCQLFPGVVCGCVLLCCNQCERPCPSMLLRTRCRFFDQSTSRKLNWSIYDEHKTVQ